METNEQDIELTAFAHGSGCGCKIAPAVLQEILKTKDVRPAHPALLVGNDSNDDAAVYQINEDEALISTTDFFTPVVDDPFLFGKIAAANSVSDVYAMGGTPLIALSVFGFPVDALPISAAQKIIEGAQAVCREVNIPLAGGHSIDSKEPIFGLAVTGSVKTAHIKRNNTAREGDLLLLTKPLGTGILAAAHKRKVLEPEHYEEWIKVLTHVNSLGSALGPIDEVHALTDVTGFGLLGHVHEMAAGSGLSAEIYYDALPVLESARGYAAQRVVPDATYRNWNAYNKDVKFAAGVPVMEAFTLLPDPQTNGGLLISVAPAAWETLEELLRSRGYQHHLQPIGKMTAPSEASINVMLKP